MNKTKVTTNKGSKSKNNKESPEVFVLPPNLLEKLGINLGTYGLASESSISPLVTDTNVSKAVQSSENKLAKEKEPVSNYTTSSKVESSIVQTAALMKKSLFLSPTFISNNTSVIQGEIEIVGNVEADADLTSAGLIHNESNVKKDEGLFINIHNGNVSVSNSQTQNSNPISVFTQESQCERIANGYVEINDVEMQTLIDDHADEAYSSDGSNNNIGCTLKPEAKPNQNKINIISEQIILPSQFYELKRNYSSEENSYIRVPLNTTITIHNQNTMQHNISNMDVLPNTTGNTEPTEISIVNQNVLKGDFNVSTTDSDILQNINKMDLCAMLNESKFVVAPQKLEDSQQDFEISQMSYKEDVITNYDVAMNTDLVLPCLIDTKHENNVTIEKSDNTNIYAVKATSTVCSSDFCVDEKMDEGFIPYSISNESKLGNNKPISCIENKNENKISPEDPDQYSLKDVTLPKINFTKGTKTLRKIFPDKNEFISSEQNDYEQISITQNGVADLINVEKNISILDKQQTNTTILSNGSKSHQIPSRASNKKSEINETKYSSGTSKITQLKKDDKNNFKETYTSPICYVKGLKKSSCEENELDDHLKQGDIIEGSKHFEVINNNLVDNKYKQKNAHEHSELHDVKFSDGGSHESNKLQIGNNKAQVQEDKIREIAEYLSKFADMKRRSHVLAVKKTVSSKKSTNKKCTTDSKSSIQGVEKPGGFGMKKSDRNYPPLKTYGRKCKRGCKEIPSYVFKECSTTTQTITLPGASSSSNFCNEMEVCLCYDFGRLKSYDGVRSYEHIHFWNIAICDCTPEIIFSIYNEDAATITGNNDIQESIENYPNEASYENLHRICWNELKSVNENKSIDFECNEENEKIDKLYFCKSNKQIFSCADGESETKRTCKASQEDKKEPTYQNNIMVTVSSLKKYEEIPNNKSDPDEHFAKTGQKRKRSIFLDDDGEPPAKSSKQRMSKRLSQTIERHNDMVDEHSKESSPIIVTPSKTSAYEHISSLVSGTIGIEKDQKGSAHLPANDIITDSFDQPNLSLYNPKNTTKQVSSNKTEVEIKTITCGVCQLSVEDAGFIDHIASQHNYLAWKSEDPPLDVDDEDSVREHLSKITQGGRGLTCVKCGLTRKYAKAYLSHVKRCSGFNVANDCSSDVVLGEKSIDLGVKIEDQSVSADFVKCGVCEESMPDSDWNDHRASRHNYLSWKLGEPTLDVNDEDAVRSHLYEISKACGGLTCAKCGLTRKYVKAYLSHVRSCAGLSVSQNDSAYDVSSLSSETIRDVNSSGVICNTDAVKESASVKTNLLNCGVCEESVEVNFWTHHIASRHNYLAWKLGDTALDVNDEDAVRNHLYEIAKACGGLTCAKCGLTRKYVKAYLSHIKKCDGLNESQNDSTYNVSSTEGKSAKPTSGLSNITEHANEESVSSKTSVKCVVCEESVQEKDWNSHIGSRHDYLAWRLGDTPLDLNDEDAVREHLYEITKTCGGLTCAKCGLTRKYVKSYLTHIKSCNGFNESQNDNTCNVSSGDLEPAKLVNVSSSKTGLADGQSEVLISASVKCAVCGETVQEKYWNSHIATRHDYLAWKTGDTPLDMSDEEAVREHLFEIKKACGGLTCAKCGLTRKYVKSYLSHTQSCNGPEISENDSSYNVELINDSITNEGDQEITRMNDSAVKCGVCVETVRENEWYSHIGSRHDYLAWKLGEPNLDVNDEAAVRAHLYEITTACGGLTCSKCGLTRKYVKSYLTHITNCNGLEVSQDVNKNLSYINEVPVKDLAELFNSSKCDATIKYGPLVKCAVCAEYLQESHWYTHIGSRHDYLAWKDGEESLDVQCKEAVRNHLRCIKKEIGGLTCAKCNANIQCAKSYLNHVKSCQRQLKDHEESSPNIVLKTQELLPQSEAIPSLVKCGVCGQYVPSMNWTQHIATNHGYLAWVDGKQPINVNNEKEVRVHLLNIIRENGTLTCSKCELPLKSVKIYLNHIATCGDNQEDMKSAFKCGVCNEVVINLHWEKHLSEKHNYLAWKVGETPVNIDDDEEVFQHLYNYVKQFGFLVCNICGTQRKHVKLYKDHIKVCKNGLVTEASADETIDDSVVDFSSGGTCAQCHTEVEAGKWIQHTQKAHNYLAWREGEEAWNLDDFQDLNRYLYVICKRMEGLTCNKCGIVRKYVKTYLTHIKNCEVSDFNLDSSIAEGIGPSTNKEFFRCAMCKEEIQPANWKNHALKQHYNITWKIGETPIDIKNPYAVEKHLKEYKQVQRILKCNVCGTTRASFSGFYAHIITCGKTEEEIDLFRMTCDICNNKYLCIYKNQHAMIHRVQTYTSELKTKPIDQADVDTSGKRRAAVKARSVIENYSDTMSKHLHACESCGFGTDYEEELKTHKCEESNEKDFSGDESSAAEIGSSDEESEDTDVDSNISNEVNEYEAEDIDDGKNGDEPVAKKRIRHREPAPVVPKVSRIPFKVEHISSYIFKGDNDFCNIFLTDEVLFPRWQCKLEAVAESELPRYLPPLEESCKVNCDLSWKMFRRFEANKSENGTSIFVGASIACIAWAPLRVADIGEGSTNYLAIACYNGPDCPRYQGHETPTHENLIQIWNFSKFERIPQIVFGIAHKFGIVWSMDWCPSGARDTPPGSDYTTRRLGLLAVACSSGSAYIFAVPYASKEVKEDQFVYQLNPVAELRMTTSSERRRYQATSVSWSKQKGHTLVLVGYADGSTAYYDLQSTSPLLMTIENNVQVFYPYNEERPHNTCITATDLYPVAGDAASCGAVLCTAPTGSELAPRGGAGARPPGRTRLPVAAHGGVFAPHACCAVLAGDDAIMHTAISELAWVGPGRRLGGIRAACGCARCGRVAVSTPPALRVMRMHPSYFDVKKQVVGLLEMVHLSKKRNKIVNDELGMVLEPLTYEDAIAKYGITFKRVRKKDKELQRESSVKPKAHCPERFPLADIVSMAFCPSRKYHEKLAVATHSGMLFLTTIN